MTEKNSTAFSRREFFTALPGAMVMMMLVQKHQQKEKESNHLV